MPRTHRRNPFTPYKEKIAALEKELQEFRDQRNLKTFSEALSRNVGIMLANTPYKDWPPLCRTAFEHEHAKAPMIGRLYQSRLP